MLKRLSLLVLVILFQQGCSTTKPHPLPENNQTTLSQADAFDEEFSDAEFDLKERFDPLSGYNRFMTHFNDKFFIYILDPVATAYKAVVHEEIRSSIGNFFHNLLFPLRFVNNLLQLKFKNAWEETARFTVNSTLGLLGLFDPAKKYFDLEPHNEDFGQTLGYWGVGSGFHIVLPFLGPSNLRDALSLFPDSYADPLYYYPQRGYNLLNNGDPTLWLISYDKVNETSMELGDYQMLKKDAVDLYPYLRDIYEQNRDRQIKE